VCVCGHPISGEELAKLDGAEALAALQAAVGKAHDEAKAYRAQWVGGATGADPRAAAESNAGSSGAPR
jgi:hypothetical protein